MTKRLINFILSIVLMGFIFINCEQKKSIKKGTVELTYWSSSNDLEIELAKILVAEWNLAHPRVQVSLTPLPEDRPAEEIIQTAIENGTTPDICSNIWPGAVPQFVEAGGLVALDRFEDFMEVMGDRTPLQMIHTLRHEDGHIYQVPWKGNPIMMQYNVKLLREADIERPPRRYSEFLEAAKKLTKDKNGDGEIDQWASDINLAGDWWGRYFDFYALYIAASGGRTLLREGKIDFNNDNAVKVFQFWADGNNQNYFPKIAFTHDVFIEGRIAFRFTGSWNIAVIEKNKPEDFEYDVVPIPVPDDHEGPVFSYRDSKDISIFSNTSYPREAWEFVKFLISKENDLQLLNVCSQIPLRKDLLTDSEFKEYFRKNPIMRKFVVQAGKTRAVDSSPHLQEIFEIISQEFFNSVIQRGKSPKQAVADAARRAEKILGKRQDEPERGAG